LYSLQNCERDFPGPIGPGTRYGLRDTDGPDAVYLFGGGLYKIYGSYTKRVP
jgi:hypothetical protein